jgi:hypothetical protein
MPNLTRARAAALNARRKVFIGSGVSLKLIDLSLDGDEDYIEVATVKDWNAKRLNPIVVGSEQTEFTIAEDGEATEERLARCQVALGNKVFRVLARTEPLGPNEKIWRLRCEQTGDTL